MMEMRWSNGIKPAGRMTFSGQDQWMDAEIDEWINGHHSIYGQKLDKST